MSTRSNRPTADLPDLAPEVTLVDVNDDLGVAPVQTLLLGRYAPAREDVREQFDERGARLAGWVRILAIAVCASEKRCRGDHTRNSATTESEPMPEIFTPDTYAIKYIYRINVVSSSQQPEGLVHSSIGTSPRPQLGSIMKPSNPFKGEDRAVSPVIGVILMVAITVILAAVIGTFVLGLGDQLGDTAPQASFSVENVNGTDITIAKTGGQPVDKADLVLSVNGERQNETWSGDDSWESGESKSIAHNSSGNDGATIRLIHDPSGSAIYEDTVDIP